MLVILDWDGTLIDSADKIVRCMRQAALDSALEPREPAAIRNIIGLGLNEALRTLYPEADGGVLADFREHYARRFVAADQTPCDFFPGVEVALKRLREAGVPLAVATGKSRRGLDRVLDNLSMTAFFHGSRCADETASKPDPRMLFELCEEFAVAPADALMVGDTEYDLEMASACGMPRIGVSYGAHPPERLERWQPLAILDEFSHLTDIVSRRYGISMPR